MRKSPLIVVLSLLPTMAFAQDSNNYQCSLNDLTRRVEIFYETGVTVSCEVHYYKDTEMPGERQVLWRAANEEGYCEAKAAEFIQKLEGMGWSCTAGAAAPAASAITRSKKVGTVRASTCSGMARKSGERSAMP